MKQPKTNPDSLIENYLPADYCDSFSRNVVSEKAITSDEFFDMAFNHYPAWVNGLMKLRNTIVKPLGLEVGMRFADKKRKLYNGMLKCDLFMYGKRL